MKDNLIKPEATPVKTTTGLPKVKQPDDEPELPESPTVKEINLLSDEESDDDDCDEESDGVNRLKKPELKIPEHTLAEAFAFPYGTFSLSSPTLSVSVTTTNLLWGKKECVRAFKQFAHPPRTKSRLESH